MKGRVPRISAGTHPEPNRGATAVAASALLIGHGVFWRVMTRLPSLHVLEIWKVGNLEYGNTTSEPIMTGIISFRPQRPLFPRRGVHAKQKHSGIGSKLVLRPTPVLWRGRDFDADASGRSREPCAANRPIWAFLATLRRATS